MAGDDHTREILDRRAPAEIALIDAMMPMLNPGGVQEIVDYGFSALPCRALPACWVGIKCVQ